MRKEKDKEGVVGGKLKPVEKNKRKKLAMGEKEWWKESKKETEKWTAYANSVYMWFVSICTD